jgi:hypothetical protein
MKKLNLLNQNPLIIFGVFLFLHLALINVNAAEWGDSYRILRASEYIRDFSYPEDEKRPPLYSAVLAVRPPLTDNIDPVVWGRAVMLFVSLGSFYVFYKFAQLVFEQKEKTNLALILFALNPVFLYWSLRIMADVFFVFLALLAFYILEYSRNNQSNNRSFKRVFLMIMLGFFVGLAVLTRFEGYLLFGAVGLGIVLKEGLYLGSLKKLTKLKTSFSKILTELLSYMVGFAVLVLPYLYYRNPLSSMYFEEPARRVYDLHTVAIYLLSFLFLFGFISAVYFYIYGYKKVIHFLQDHTAITAFLFAELLLILAWPAAIPRLFVAIVPLLILLLSLCIVEYFWDKDDAVLNLKLSAALERTLGWKIPVVLILNLTLILIYVLGQYYYRLQFLVPVKSIFIMLILINLLGIYFIYKKSLSAFVLTIVFSMMLWSWAVIYMHKDIFKMIKQANVYTIENLQGKVAYNDISSVSDWYLNVNNPQNIEGVFYDLTQRPNREYVRIAEKNIDYFIVTNEHNTTMRLDLDDWPHLEEIAEFRQSINNEVFWTKIIRFNRL